MRNGFRSSLFGGAVGAVAWLSTSVILQGCSGQLGPDDPSEDLGPGSDPSVPSAGGQRGGKPNTTGAGASNGTGGQSQPGLMGMMGMPPGTGGTGSMPPQVTPPTAMRPMLGGLRALTRVELTNTLRDLLGDNGRAASRLPEDTLDLHEFAFDNNRHANEKLGLNMVRALELLYQDVLDDAMADAKRRAMIVPCMPASATDAACMKQFVADFGLRALRRPLAPEEAALYEGFIDVAKDNNDFFAGASAAARAILMNPEFVYRVEAGTPVAQQPGIAKLSGYEIASRLSFTLAGTAPDRMLLEEARMGKLDTPEGRRASATRVFGSANGRARMLHFHAYWLSFQHVLPTPNDPFVEETRSLINDVVFDGKRDYKELFLSNKTFIGSTLRKHYADLAAPAATASGWVNYPAADPAKPGSERAGIFSHGTFLSARKDGDETSVPRRGGLIAARLLCAPVPDPPPDATVDLSGLASTCVTGPNGFYAKTHAAPSCAACHNILDPLGVGLERFDAAGRYRQTDTKKPQCKIDTSIAKLSTPAGTTPFDGPASFARAYVNSGAMEACVARHAFRFMNGGVEETADESAIGELAGRFKNAGRDFSGLWADMVSSPAFGLARLP